MIKIAILGAGSVVFTKNLTGDILSYPEFKNATFTYMDIDEERLKVGVGLCRRIAKGLGADPVIEGTLDRREALEGADFVITTVQVGGFNSTLVDFEIPRKYGLPFTIADTTGPGGVFRALRTFPFFTGLVQDMEEICPGATLLNYSNPMCMNMLTIQRQSNISSVGLCHSVQGTHSQLMRYIDVPAEESNYICAGINHMAFYLSLEHRGEDLYPRLFEAMDQEKIYETNKVRFEIMRRLGYFITESSEHNAEYCPYFIPHGHETIEKYDIPVDEYLRRCDSIVDRFDELINSSQLDEPLEHHRSHEYGSTIINSIATNTPSVVYGNMTNDGCISNLPDDAIVEAPTLVDGNGLSFASVGDLPPQVVGYVMPHVVQYELAYRAAAEGRRDHLYQACMNDPLTSSMLTLNQIVEMCDEMVAGHGDLLPTMDRSPRGIPFSGKSFEATRPEDLREAWESRKVDNDDIVIRSWSVGQGDVEVGPELLGRFEDLMDKGAVEVQGRQLNFEKKLATIQGFLSHPTESGTCVAATELESIHQRETTISIGSHADAEVWLNGEKVLSVKNGPRPFKAKEDTAKIRLKEGWNRIVVASDAAGEEGGFALTIPKAEF